MYQMYVDSLDALDAHVQWGAEGFLPQSPPVKAAKLGAPEPRIYAGEGDTSDEA